MNDEYFEVLDLVNSQDEVVGTTLRGEMAETSYYRSGRYVRFANAFVVNKMGLVWVQTRNLHKFIAPGGLDYSVAEHVLSGETYEQAVIRGFDEELGWDIDQSKLHSLGKLPPTKEKPVFDMVYALFDYSGEKPKLNHDEFATAEWLSIAGLKGRLAASDIAQKTSLVPAFSLLQDALHKRKK
jgi:isopentenyldiphosphate isomerase